MMTGDCRDESVIWWAQRRGSGRGTLDPRWDHDHCEFCGIGFAGPEAKDALHEGYATEDLYQWVCPRCFEDMRERFQFELLP